MTTTVQPDGFINNIFNEFDKDVSTESFETKLTNLYGLKGPNEADKYFLLSILLLDRMGEQNRDEVENILEISKKFNIEFDPLITQKQSINVPGTLADKSRLFYCQPTERFPIFLYTLGILNPNRRFLESVLTCPTLTTRNNVASTYKSFLALFEKRQTIWRVHQAIDAAKFDEFVEAMKAQIRLKPDANVQFEKKGKIEENIVKAAANIFGVHFETFNVQTIPGKKQLLYTDPLTQLFKLYAYCMLRENGFEASVASFVKALPKKVMEKTKIQPVLLLFTMLDDVEIFELIDGLFPAAKDKNYAALLCTAVGAASLKVINYLVEKIGRDEVNKHLAKFDTEIDELEGRILLTHGTGLAMTRKKLLHKALMNV